MRAYGNMRRPGMSAVGIVIALVRVTHARKVPHPDTLCRRRILGGAGWRSNGGMADRAGRHVTLGSVLTQLIEGEREGRMKRVGMLAAVSTLVFALAGAGATGTWKQIHPLFENVEPKDMTFVDSLHGWIVGTLGNNALGDLQGSVILRTASGGETWTADTFSAYDWLGPVFFLDDTLGWVAGSGDRHGVVLKTVDGGVSWKEAASTAGGVPSRPILHCFTDPHNGWLSELGVLLHSEDGGATWHTSWADTTAHIRHIRDVHFTDRNNGWVTGDRWVPPATPPGHTLLLRTQDGGQTWLEDTSLAAFEIRGDICFSDAAHGWILGNALDTVARTSKNIVLHTSDAGETWAAVDTMSDSLHPLGWAFTDTLNGWMLATQLDGQEILLRSVDGGRTWEPRQLSPTGYLNAGRLRLSGCDAVDTRHGWLVGVGVIDNAEFLTVLATEDGGGTWSLQTSPGVPSLNDVCTVGETNVWIAGSDGTILHAADGGADGFSSFVRQTSGTDRPLYSIGFFDSSFGLAAGSNVLLRTTDGGSHWDHAGDSIRLSLRGIHFNGAGHAWVHDGETVLHSVDRGLTWDTAHVPVHTDERVNDVHFVDAHTGWAVGDHRAYQCAGWYCVVSSAIGLIWSTTDGGRTWHRQAESVSVPLNGVSFADSRHGWAIGWGIPGLVMRTTDGGSTWDTTVTNYAHPLESRLTDLCFVDSLTGWIVGKEGAVYGTYDGGVTWRKDTCAGGNTFTAVSAADRHHAWAVSGPRILRYTEPAGSHSVRPSIASGPANSSAANLTCSRLASGHAAICFRVPSDSRATLTVHDAAGRTLCTLRDGRQHGDGQRVVWSTRGVARGVYFCLLRTRSPEGVRRSAAAPLFVR
ncbi:MAG: hypothetical protein GF331_10020 [Chitinivibrionales bacterium]|nr:hypothetical protein [Chitinivibrionales bacterium]